MSGVFLKEQEIKSLINLGLGFMLKEIKMMRASGRDPFGNKEDEQIKDVKEYDQIIEPKMPDRMRNTLG